MTREPLIETAREGAWIIARWFGDIDMANAGTVEHQTLDALDNMDDHLTIDLSRVDYIDSAGIRAIIGVRRLLAERQQRLSLIVPSDSTLRKALEVGGMLAVVPTYESEPDARAAG